MASQPMLPASTDIATVWAFLEEGVDHIMTQRDTDLPYERFWALYTVQYNYCTSSGPSTRGNLPEYDLYNSLVRYFERYSQHLRDVRHFVHDDRITMNTSCSIRIHYKTSSS